VQVVESTLLHLRASAALLACGIHPTQADGQPLLRPLLLDRALRDARRLLKKKVAGFSALAELIEATVATASGQIATAISLLEHATAGLEANDMHLHAAAAKHRLGELVGGDRGRAKIAEAREFMNLQGVRNPDRMLQVLAPSAGLAESLRSALPGA
jgi:hypothetical protein